MRKAATIRTAAAGAAAALLLTTYGLTPALAGTSGPRHAVANGGDQVNYGQLAANAVAERVESAVSAGHLSGFAGDEVSPSPTNPGVTIYWHGRVPALLPRLAAAAGSVRASGITAGVTVRFMSAPYSQTQLMGLEQAIYRSPGFRQAGVSSMGFYPQATGFWVGVNTQGDLANVRRLPVIAHSRIPVHYFVSPTEPLSVPGRYKDTPPFWGGDFIQSKYGTISYQCSTGFGMHFANRKGNPWFMLTAAHCAVHSQLGTQKFSIWGNHLNVGVTASLDPFNDVVALYTGRPWGVRGAGGGRKIYTGNTSLNNARGQAGTAVVGAARVLAGDAVSTSGAFSGERTQIHVTTTTWDWFPTSIDGFPYQVFGARAIKTNHSNAAGKGDSGGPVFVNARGGIKAVGIISAAFAAHRAICTGITANNRKCFWDIFFSLMTGTSTSIEANLHMTLNL
jgi:hypothetical protein